MQNSLIHNDNKIRKLSNRGTTMLETLVAFVVLTAIMGILFGIIAFCSELRISAADTNRAMETFSRELYSDNITGNSITVQNCTETNKRSGTSYRAFFYLELDKENTNPANIQNLPDKNQPISMEDIKAKTYTYTETGYNGVVPETINFIHRKDWTDSSSNGNTP